MLSRGSIRGGRRRSSQSSGFTLVELLVVIGIIALLMSILFPSFARVRAQARKTVCLSNLRQLGQAAHMYAADNKGWLPTRYNGAPWPPQVLFWGGRDERPIFAGYLGGYTVERSNPVLYCPGNDGLIHSYERAWNNGLGGMYLIGYAYFGGYPYSQFWNSTTKQPRKANQKGNIPLFGDMAEDKTISHPSSRWLYISHAKGANSSGVETSRLVPEGVHCVTLDGSARWYAYDSDPQRSQMEVCIKVPGASDPGFFWGKPLP